MGEADMRKHCGEGIKGGSMYGDAFKEILHTSNLRRWVHVFGKEQVLCVNMYDLKDNADRVFKKIATFLEVDSTGFPSRLPPSQPANLIKRLEDIQRKEYGDGAVLDMRRVIAR